KTKDNCLLIEVDDNGSGLTAKVADKQKKKSLAQIIIKERFDLLFTSKGQLAHFKVEDKKESAEKGVLVKILIPIIND
ncbi:MAG: sensor histidine kinase, partial [Pedobacter agri]